MRKIKYKAWSECCQDFLNITGFECTDGEITGIFHDGDYIGYDKDDIVLLNYTGFKDANKKEIYDGYILEKSNHWRIRIEHEDGAFWVRDAESVRYTNKILEIPITMFNLDNWEIIGNIY